MLTSAVVSNLHPSPRARSCDLALDGDWLPKVNSADVAALNALYRHRRAIGAKLLGHAVTIETNHRIEIDGEAVSFRFALAGRAGILRLPAQLAELCANSLGVDEIAALGDMQSALVVELALLSVIKSLETQLQADVRIVLRTAATSDGLVPFRLLISGLPVGPAAVEILLDRRSAAPVARLLDQFAEPNVETAGLPIPVRICVDSADLTVREMSSLRPGDIVMSGQNRNAEAVVAVIGDRLHARVENMADGWQLASVPADVRVNTEGGWFMQQATEAIRDPSIDEAALERVPIRVVFEIGRFDIPLTEIRRLAPGYVLPLVRPSEDAVDIVANGRKIGHGSLIKIGDSVGVRVERLVTDD
jgi:type III secretion protein Q